MSWAFVGGIQTAHRDTHTPSSKMFVPRLLPSHRIRQAGGPTHPATKSLAEFWRTFDPRDPKEIILRFHSAPWDDIIDYPEDTPPQVVDPDQPSEPDTNLGDDLLPLKSPTGNLIQWPPPPTWCWPFDVTPAHSQIQLPDEVATTTL
jgi:hypothetical protein